MIFVSGTKRSGTSMWMQVLRAAGLPILGKAFPRDWGSGPLRDANPDGFYETLLRTGVYFATNPHPRTGKYFRPDQVDGYAVKVFVPGVVRSERAYIGHLIANVRAWREYEASILRLQAIEAATRAQRRAAGAMVVEPYEFPPAYEWWMENFTLLRDITLRRLPARLQTYDQVLADPEATIAGVLGWIGRGDVAAAMTAVKPEHRTQLRPSSDSVAPALARVFDDLYAGVAAGKGISGALLRTLNETNLALLPELARLQAKVAQSQQMRARTTGRAPPIEIDGLPELD